MKRLLACLSALLLALSLTACSTEFAERPDELPATAGEQEEAPTQDPVDSPNGEQFLEISDQLPFSLDWDGDGEAETIDIRTVKIGNGSGDTAFHLDLENGGKSWRSMNLGVWSVRLYLTDLEGDGVYELFLSGDAGSDDYITYCWHLTVDNPEVVTFTGETRYDNVTWTDYVAGAFCGLDKGGRILISSYLYMLGTYSGTRAYALNDEGEIAPVEGTIWEYDGNALPITTRIALTADTADERNGAPNGGTLTLPAGTRLTLTGSDGISRAWFVTDDGQFGSFAAEKVDWQWFIAGMDENEVFSDLPYAG